MYLLLILSLVPFINGQVAKLGYCKNIQAVDDFRPDDLTGTWYIIAVKPNMFDDGLKCTFMTYEYVKDGGYFNSNYTGLNEIDGTPTVYEVNTKIPQPGVADFRTTVKVQEYQIKVDLKVIEVDYNNYAAYWGCEQRNKYCVRYVWLLARQNNLSPELRTQALNAYTKNGLMIDDLIFIDHNNCTYN